MGEGTKIHLEKDVLLPRKKTVENLMFYYLTLQRFTLVSRIYLSAWTTGAPVCKTLPPVDVSCAEKRAELQEMITMQKMSNHLNSPYVRSTAMKLHICPCRATNIPNICTYCALRQNDGFEASIRAS